MLDLRGEKKTGRKVPVLFRKAVFLLLLTVIVSIVLTGCGTEIARASIQNMGDFQLNFEHDGSPVQLWTDLDIEYIDETTIWYEIEIWKGEDKIADLICSPFDHSYRLMARHAEVRGVNKESFLAPMTCEIGGLPAGEIQMDIALFAEGGRVRIFRADLVVKEKE